MTHSRKTRRVNFWSTPCKYTIYLYTYNLRWPIVRYNRITYDGSESVTKGFFFEKMSLKDAMFCSYLYYTRKVKCTGIKYKLCYISSISLKYWALTLRNMISKIIENQICFPHRHFCWKLTIRNKMWSFRFSKSNIVFYQGFIYVSELHIITTLGI